MHVNRKNIFAIGLAIFITSCTSISLTGMYRLSQLTPLSINPAHIKVALKTDKAIQVNDGAVSIEFGYKSDDGTIDINDKFNVNIDNDAPIAQSLFGNINTNEYVTILSLTEKDAKKFQQNQQIISAHKAQDKKGKGSFSLSLDKFCLPDPLPERDLTIDVSLQTEQKDGFFTFLSDVDLKDQLNDLSPKELKNLEESC